MFRRRRVLPMLDPRYTGFRDAPPRLTDPSAATDGSVGDGAPQFASQLDAAKALHNRLHRDRVPHSAYHAIWNLDGTFRGYEWALDRQGKRQPSRVYAQEGRAPDGRPFAGNDAA